MKLTLHPPLEISARLLPAVRFDTFTVSLDPFSDWAYYIDFHGEAEGTESIGGNDFQPSRLMPEDDSEAVRQAMGSLLSVVGAFAEAVQYEERTGRDSVDLADLFPARFREWASFESDEISLATFDLEEG